MVLSSSDSIYNQKRKEQEECIKQVLKLVGFAHKDNDAKAFINPELVYNYMYKVQPKRFISRFHFITAMQAIYRSRSKRKTETFGQNVLLLLNRLYASFDVLQRDGMDWRKFILLLYICSNPLVSIGDALLFGFSLFTSSDLFDNFLENNGKIKFQEAKRLFEGIIQNSLINKVYDFCDDVWIELFLDKTGSNLNTLDQYYINKMQFKVLLSHRLFGNLFQYQPIASSNSKNDYKVSYVYAFEAK